MSRILEHLERWSWRGSVVQKADTGMKPGHVWDYPLKLERGVDYLIQTTRSKNVKSMTCSLTNGYESPALHEATGPAPSFSFVPKMDGVYMLHVTLDSTGNGAAPGAVGVTLLREREHSRAIAIASWPRYALSQLVP